ncbi:MAG: hypothetical protein LLF94_01070 [Chlamydiales bacterium]|nr:hypothetical protein [Chlamydiales bacterium]
MDQAFEALINTYAEASIAQSGDISDAQKETIRQNVRHSLTTFRDKFQKGYDTIGVWLVEQGIDCPALSTDDISSFSDEDVQKIYKAAYSLLQEKSESSYAKARDAFFFLVTIAPQVVDFWLGYSHSTTQLKEYEDALDATLHALECNPTLPDIYLQAFFLYLELNQKEEALALCRQGIDFAKSHNDPWAKTLSTALQEANARLIREK